MAGSETRETIGEEVKYLYFDIAIDPYLAGEVPLQQAVLDYYAYVGGLVTPPEAA